MLGFLGPNGAGKTTTMRAVFGLVEPDAGEVLWDGRPIGSAERLRFGYMPEERGLYPRMPVGEQLEYFGRLHGMDASGARRGHARWLERLGLEGRAGAKVEELSHGNQQRAQLAAALVHEPELLVLDEPFAGLDPVAVHTLAEVLRGRGRPRRRRPLLQPPARARGGHLRGGRDHRPRPHRRHGRRGRTAGAPRSGGGSSCSSTGAPPQWLPDVAGVELVERRNGDLRLLAESRRRPGAGARGRGAVGAGRRVQLRAAVARRALPRAGGPMSGAAARSRSSRGARSASGCAARRSSPRRSSCSRSSAARPRSARWRSRRRRLPGRGDGAGAARPRRRAPAGGASRSTTRRSSCASSRRRRPDGRRSKPRRSTRCCSCPTDRLVFRTEVDAKAAAVADTAVRALRRQLPPAPELTTATLRPPEEETATPRTLVAYAGSLLLLMSLAIYGQWVISGVVEEKNNRVVELILSTVRPRHLLAGKVIGIGLLGFAQLVLVAGLAAALLVAGVFDAPAELGGDMALVIPWFALGFALYAVAYAAAGALASRQQNADTAGQPVTYTLLAVYFAGYVALSADPEGLLATRPHGLPADRAARPPRPQRARRRAALGARARRRPRPRLDLRARPLRRPRLRPRPPPRRPLWRPSAWPRGLATRPAALEPARAMRPCVPTRCARRTRCRSRSTCAADRRQQPCGDARAARR